MSYKDKELSREKKKDRSLITSDKGLVSSVSCEKQKAAIVHLLLN